MYQDAIKAINDVIAARERFHDHPLSSSCRQDYLFAVSELSKHFETILEALRK